VASFMIIPGDSGNNLLMANDTGRVSWVMLCVLLINHY